MSVIRVERHERLRLGGVDGTLPLAAALPNGERPVIRRKPGVLVFEDIPVGAQVHVRVDRPTELNEESALLATPTEFVAAGPPTMTFAAGPPSTVTRSAGSFITDGYVPGMRLIVDSPLNGGEYTIADVTALVITLVHTEAFVAEGPLGGGETLNGGPVNVQPYVFEHAQLPAAFTVGGVQFRSRTRVLNVIGGSSIQETQHVPAYASFVPDQAGSLVQKGKGSHLIPMPDGNIGEADRELLRLRWVGTAVAGATLFVAVGGETVLEPATTPLWPNGHVDLVPGSIVVTLTGGAGTLRDDGAGRLVGAGGDGQVDYQSGAFHIDLNAAAAAGNVTVNYEHGCLYSPLDVFVEWDSRLR